MAFNHSVERQRNRGGRMNGTFYAKLTGFRSLAEAEAFLDWFEGSGEQDEGLTIYLDRVTGEENTYVNCDVHTGMIHHADGVEYLVDVGSEDDEFEE